MDKNYTFYVMLSKTTTKVSRMIGHAIEDSSYIHASIVMDNDMTEIYSYGRRVVSNPFISGFIYEDLDKGILAMNHPEPCKLFRVDITHEVYERLIALLDDFKSHYKQCKYNFLGLAALNYGKRLPRKGRKYTCTQFVASVLEDSGAVPKLVVDRWLTLPSDIAKNKELVPIYEGTIGGVRQGLKDYLAMQNN